MAGRATTRSRIARRGRRAGRQRAARPRHPARRRRRGGDRRLAAVPACRLPARSRAGRRRSRAFIAAPGAAGSRRIFRACARRSSAGGAAARTDRRVALPGAGAALRRPGLADLARALRRGRRLCGDPADGGCRSGPAARPRAAQRRSARRSSPRRGAIGATGIGGGRCATSSACRCIFFGVPPRADRADIWLELFAQRSPRTPARPGPIFSCPRCDNGSWLSPGWRSMCAAP